VRIELLTSAHDIDGFESGVKPLDDWLVGHALLNQQRNLSRTFVLLDDSDVVIGFYSLTMGGVRVDQPPRRFGRGLPRYDIGMVLLGRLAIDTSSQGQGLGRDLLIDAIYRAAIAGESAVARFIAVDPIEEAARCFYSAFGFLDVPGDDHGRMFLRIDEALAAFHEGDDIH
jgi:GNAT superfamily N-acetyltransferase